MQYAVHFLSFFPMKKILALALTVFIVVSHSAAQNKGTISLSLGPAIPVGDFASKNGFVPSSGLANIGALADLSYQRLFSHSRFGWMATLRGRFNGVDKNGTIAPFAAEFPGYEWSMNSNRWIAASALVGGYYQLPVTPKLSLTANIELGVAEAWSPKQSITGVHDSAGYGALDVVYANARAVSATAFTGLGGLGIRYQWRSRWALLARVDYTYLKPTFKITANIETAQHFVYPNQPLLLNASEVEYNSTTGKYTQAMPCVNVLVGIIREL
jgi:hypothetical protein